MPKHPAHELDYDTLLGGLNEAVASGQVYERRDGDLSLYCYTRAAVYDQSWTPFTVMSRGLILDRAARRIAATPFPKFFNLGEDGRQAPSPDFEAYEKLDGSLIIAFWHGNGWRTATKGDFHSDQAKAAQTLLPFDKMVPGTTYLTELIGPSNKIVVRYPADECRLIGAYGPDGREFLRAELEALELGGLKLAKTYQCNSLAELVAQTATLPLAEEGYVLRFPDGTRLKLKGNEYRRVHALISRLSPLSVWEAVAAGDTDAMRRELPEEFWGDFDAMHAILQGQADALLAQIKAEAAKWAGASDKEVGLALKTIPEPARAFIFAHRSGQLTAGKSRQAFYRSIRPTGNELAGYSPSYTMRRAAEELIG
jgi:RNA ligase